VRVGQGGLTQPEWSGLRRVRCAEQAAVKASTMVCTFGQEPSAADQPLLPAPSQPPNDLLHLCRAVQVPLWGHPRNVHVGRRHLQQWRQ
jgi:hypothetical protein